MNRMPGKKSAVVGSVCLLLAIAAPARAWHVAGTVYCDQNGNGMIDGADTPLVTKTVQATSQSAHPGTTSSDVTDASGYYFIGLPDDSDTYAVTLIGLPGGQTIVVPAGGVHTITLDFSQDHRDDIDFLVSGCGATATTTTTHASSTSGPTTTTTSTSTTTTIPGPCSGIPFVTCEGGSINNDTDILASIAANGPDATLRLSHDAFTSDGTVVIAEHVELGDGANVYRVLTHELHRGQNVTVRNGVASPPPLPLQSPCCPIAPITCGTGTTLVRAGETLALTPGTYGALRLQNTAIVTLAPGTYSFCDVKTGRSTAIRAEGAVTLNVRDTLRVGVDSHLEPTEGGPAVVVHVGGKKVKFTQNGVAKANIVAPNAILRLGRSASVEGGFCVGKIQTDKHTNLQCP
jgi:hypothetical protein